MAQKYGILQRFQDFMQNFAIKFRRLRNSATFPVFVKMIRIPVPVFEAARAEGGGRGVYSSQEISTGESNCPVTSTNTDWSPSTV